MTRTSRRLPALALSSVLLVPVTACGDDTAATQDDGGTTAATGEPATEADGDDEPDEAVEAPETAAEPEPTDEPGEVLGTVVVDGTTYDMDEVRRCEPLDDGPFETELELQARGTVPAGEGYQDQEWVQIDVYVRSVGGASLDDVSWAGPQGAFGGAPDTVIEVRGDEVTGSATPVEAMTQEGSVSVEFSLPVPEELLDCRS